MIPVDEHLPGFTVSLMTNLRLRIFEIILQGRHPSMPPTSVRASVHPNSEVDVTASCSSSSRTAAASVRIIPDASRTTRAPPTSSWFDPEPNVQCPPVRPHAHTFCCCCFITFIYRLCRSVGASINVFKFCVGKTDFNATGNATRILTERLVLRQLSAAQSRTVTSRFV